MDGYARIVKNDIFMIYALHNAKLFYVTDYVMYINPDEEQIHSKAWLDICISFHQIANLTYSQITQPNNKDLRLSFRVL